MARGNFTLSYSDGSGVDYPLLTAIASVGRAAGGWWFGVQGGTTPPDWACPPDVDIPEYPVIDVSAQVAGPEPAAWVGREFTLPEERDPRTGFYPAWLYTTGGYEALVGCAVSVGDRVGERVAVRITARGSSSGCRIEVVGEFALAFDGARAAEPGGGPDPVRV